MSASLRSSDASVERSSLNATGEVSAEEVAEVRDGELVAIAEAVEVEEKSGSPDEGGRKRRKVDPLYQWVILGLCVGTLALSMFMSVREGTQVLMPFLGKPLPELCHMKRYTGVECPGCGMTRAFISLGHGRLADAWRYNPAAFLLFPLMVVQIPFRAAQLWRVRRGLPELQAGWWGNAAVMAVVVVMIGQWVIKQLGAVIG